MSTETRGRGRPRGSSSKGSISVRSYGLSVDALEVGQRVFVEINPEAVERSSRQIATTLNNSPRFQGKSYSVRRMTALESRFGTNPIYLISIERKA